MNHIETYFHADYRDLLDKQIEYTPPIPIRIDGRGPATGLALPNCQLDPSYWVPSQVLHAHMRAMVVKHAPRKLRVALAGAINPNFASFPVGYDPRQIVEQKVITADGEVNVVQTELCHMLIDDTVRVSMLEPSSQLMRLQRSCYLDQLASNISCDEGIGKPPTTDELADPPIPARADAFTFRDLDRDLKTGQLRPLELCHQANTVGVGTLFFDADGVPLLRPRGLSNGQIDGELAVMPSGLHWTSSGAMQWQDFPADPGLAQWGFMNAMQREIEEETGILRQDYRLVPLCFAREFERGGKPQLFFAATFNAAVRLADGTLLDYLRGKSGIDRWETLRETRQKGVLRSVLAKVRNRRSDKVAHWYLRDDLRIAAFDLNVPKRFADWQDMTYECRAALYFAAQFVQAWQGPQGVNTSTA